MQQLRRDRKVTPFGHSRARRPGRHYAAPSRCRRRPRARDRRRAGEVVDVFEHDRRFPRGSAGAVGSGDLHHRAVGAEVAAEHDQRASLVERVRRAGGSRLVDDLRRSRVEVLGERSGRLRSSRRGRSEVADLLEHRGQPARVVEVLHQMLAGGLEVRPATASSRTARRSSDEWQVDAEAAGVRDQVDDRVGRARDRMQRPDRVLEGLTRQDVRRPDVRARRARRSSRPAASATCARRASTAGIAAAPGSVSPSASVTQAIVDAVPIVMQWPFERDIEFSISVKSSR